MSYETARLKQVRDVQSRVVEAALTHYRPGRKTVVFLPGGMGSQLDRTRKPWTGSPSQEFRKFETLWFDFGMLFNRDAVKLAITPNGRDKGNHIVVPDREVRFLVKPYDGLERFFRQRECNYLVFGFDWRRPLEESAQLLEFFLKRYRTRVQALFGENPLPKTTVVGHSQGGLVLKAWIYRMFDDRSTAAEVKSWMSRAIMVGTPFGGTTNHLERYYQGVPYFDIVYGKKDLAKLIGGLPGCYVLMPFDRQLYQQHGAALGLQRYPVRDGQDPSQEADPYDPNEFGRYPGWASQTSLYAAMDSRLAIFEPLPAAVKPRVTNLYSVANPDTYTELLWTRVNGATYDPDNDPSPVSGNKGEGDGTVPAWAGRLPDVLPENVFKLRQAADHVGLMEHTETLSILGALLDGSSPAALPDVAHRSIGGEAASDQDLTTFLGEIAAGTIARTDPRASDERLLRRLQQRSFL